MGTGPAPTRSLALTPPPPPLASCAAAATGGLGVFTPAAPPRPPRFATDADVYDLQQRFDDLSNRFDELSERVDEAIAMLKVILKKLT